MQSSYQHHVRNYHPYCQPSLDIPGQGSASVEMISRCHVAPLLRPRPAGQTQRCSVRLMSELFDIAIIGAGFAGLSTAESLATRGYRVALLEARGRVGGRKTPHRWWLWRSGSILVEGAGQTRGAPPTS